MRARARHWLGLGVLAAVLTAGCAIGPDYKRPPVTPPDAFRFQTTPGETASLADAPWWEAFQDPALKALIEEALANNDTVRIAAARVQQARAQAAVARAPFFPQIGYNVGAAQSKGLQNFLGIGTGAGANSRRILGSTVMGGMLAATLIAIFIIPVTFYFAERFAPKPKAHTEPGAVPTPAPIHGGAGDDHPRGDSG